MRASDSIKRILLKSFDWGDAKRIAPLSGEIPAPAAV
jgi:hypothetical protein